MAIAIGLTRGLTTIVDDEDSDVAQIPWYATRYGYAVTNRKGQKRTTVFLHRVILERIVGGPLPPGLETDHINRDRLDNRRENLRAVTRSENQANSERPRGRSGYRGVRQGRAGSWYAQISLAGKKICIGRFASPEAAAKAYDEVARHARGEFARLNNV